MQPHRRLVTRQRLPGAAVLEQDLALELLEKRVVGTLGDQAVDHRQRPLQIGGAIIGDGAGVAAFQAAVAFRVLLEHAPERSQETDELRPHPSVRRDEIGRLCRVGIRRIGDVIAHRLDAVVAQRVRAQIGVLLARQQQLLVAQDFEELEHAAGRLPGEQQGLIQRHWSARDEPGAQGGVRIARLAGDQLQGQEGDGILIEYLIAAHDVGVAAQLHPGGPFPQEALAGSPVGQEFGLEGLDGQRALLLVVEADVHHPHPALHRVAGYLVTLVDQETRGIRVHDAYPL